MLRYFHGGVDVVEDCIHETADGRRLWVTHGDLFDGVIQCARWLAVAGDIAYETTLRFNRHLNRFRARLGLPYWSLSRYLKLKVKRAVSYVCAFEEAVAREVRKMRFEVSKSKSDAISRKRSPSPSLTQAKAIFHRSAAQPWS